MHNITSRFMRVIGIQFDCDTSGLTTDTKIIDDIGADSLDAVELIMATEEEFGIEITDEQAELLDTIGDCINTIRFHLREEEEEVEFPKPPKLKPVDLEGVNLQHNIEIATAVGDQFIATLAAGHVVECRTENNSYKRALVRLGYEAALAIVTAQRSTDLGMGEVPS